MMAVLGAVQDKVQKTGPEEAAECGLLQSKRPHATVQDVVAVNKMVGRMKAGIDRCLPIHSHIGPSLVAVCWEDTAFGNRPDGSSTEGYVVGISTPEILQGEEALVTLVDWGSHKILKCADQRQRPRHAAWQTPKIAYRLSGICWPKHWEWAVPAKILIPLYQR